MSSSTLRLALAASVLLACAHRPVGEPAAPASWTDDYVGRLTALAVLQTLNAELLAGASATLTLDRWCEAHRMASPARVVAVRDRAAHKEATAEQRTLLAVTGTEPLRYRRVQLTCGARVLSEADNWYVPARLTAEMNHQLETTDVAFGRAVQALQFRRRTLSARLLWAPLPDGWDMTPVVLPDAGARPLHVPRELLQHQAVLTLPDGTPLSLVIETYTDEVLGFPQPRPAT